MKDEESSCPDFREEKEVCNIPYQSYARTFCYSNVQEWKGKKKYSRPLLKIQSVNSEKKESYFHTTGLLLGKEA